MMTVTYDLDTWREGDQVFSAMAKCVGGAYVLAEDYEALQSELAERQENLNVQDGVIAGLKEEIAEQKRLLDGYRVASMANSIMDTKHRERIAALEKVAEAAAKIWNPQSWLPVINFDELGEALREAGYLKEEGDG
jgi:glutathione synthase/RimK-type ligase-like ATP-grasp enzyme